MLCPVCEEGELVVLETREGGLNRENRKRGCPKCKRVFTTEEVLKKCVGRSNDRRLQDRD